MYEIRTLLGDTICRIEDYADYDDALAYYGEDRDGTVIRHIPEFALCEGRHDMPCDEAIFPGTIEDPTDVMGLVRIASDKLGGCKTVVVYVTGLTVALVAVINACRDMGINLCLKHYDRNTGSYYNQWLF